MLSSSYAKLAGIPVAGLSLVAYLAMAALFGLAARRSDDRLAQRHLALGATGVIGSLVFSVYMAVVAVIRIETLCLLCIGLYAVAIANTGLAAAALRVAVRAEGKSPLRPAAATAVLLAGTVFVVALAFFTWPAPTAALSASIRTAEDVRAADPKFYDWYTSLPKVDRSSLLRDDQQGAAGEGKVVVVDFFDLECAHCRKNYLLVKELATRRGSRIEVVHRHFPLDATCNDIVPMSIHPNACRAAEAVECAGLQGKHDEMLDIMFRNQGQLFAENLTRLAGKIGLDQEAMQRCLSEHLTLPTVLADARAGAKLDITSTPTVFVGQRRLKGVLEEVGQYEMAVILEGSAQD